MLHIVGMLLGSVAALLRCSFPEATVLPLLPMPRLAPCCSCNKHNPLPVVVLFYPQEMAAKLLARAPEPQPIPPNAPPTSDLTCETSGHRAVGRHQA